MRQTSPERVLILRPGALGDVVLALPVVALIRHRWSGAHFSWVGYPSYLAWLEGSSYLDSFHSIDRALFCHLFDGASDQPLDEFLESYDFCLAWVHDPPAHLQRRLARCYGEHYLIAAPFPGPGSGIHATDHLLRTLTSIPHFPITPDTQVPDSLKFPPEPRATTVGRPGRLLIHPGGGSSLKCWPLANFESVAGVIRELQGMEVEWLLGPAEEDLAERLAPFCDRNAMKVYSGLPLRQVVERLREARFYLGNDSGITHLAAALGVETYAVFGPTSPLEWAPRGEQVHVFARALPCIPCTRPEMKSCLHRQCLTALDPDEIIQQMMASYSRQMLNH